MDRIKRRKRRRRSILRRALICCTAAGVIFLAAAGTARFVNFVEERRGGLAVSSAYVGPRESEPPPRAGLTAASSAVSPPSLPPASLPSKPPAGVSGSPPESMAAESWFDDAAFIGDSRTEGLALYDGLGNASYYAHKGLMVSTVDSEPAVRVGGKKVSVMQALRRKKFKKIYIMLGVNELGWSSSKTFVEEYGKLVDEIKKCQPGAKVYLQSILPVTATKSESGGVYTNTRIESYNRAIQKIAKDRKVRYLAVNSAVSDTQGCLPEEASTDGVHLNARYCGKWCEYLRAHT